MNIESFIKTENKIPVRKKAIINLLFTHGWIMDKINLELKNHDISIQQFNVLRILNGQKGKPANLSTIQERMVTKMSNTTRLVDKLIQKGYTTRTICPSNRRKVEITITQKGTEFLNIVSPIMDDFENKITSNLTEEDLDQLNIFLDQLRNQNFNS
ncbi:MarR family winged helix-turn-helix transcriptional regulator [Aquimarina algicola]|uniref:MarR family transcriptional regulator n=1 Tax=Aquimarina algicola TaxID=2589995 RepID=A0A504J1B5_9FLAO|nr:MarR family transcriptional regulator [Aquimarina algicola]TPN84627.1 MarR family transcriptional regulator [Aquimarina algicola]